MFSKSIRTTTLSTSKDISLDTFSVADFIFAEVVSPNSLNFCAAALLHVVIQLSLYTGLINKRSAILFKLSLI